MTRKEYPAHWRQELIDELQAYPRWQEYSAGGRLLAPKDILFSWNAAHDGLVAAFDALKPENGDNMSALWGIAHAMKQSIRDLDDIIAFVHTICDEFIPPSAWEPDSEHPDNVVHLQG